MITYRFVAESLGKEPPWLFAKVADDHRKFLDQATAPLELIIPMEQIRQEGVSSVWARIERAVKKMVEELNKDERDGLDKPREEC